jgi:hypothetical protein
MTNLKACIAFLLDNNFAEQMKSCLLWTGFPPRRFQKFFQTVKIFVIRYPIFISTVIIYQSPFNIVK